RSQARGLEAAPRLRTRPATPRSSTDAVGAGREQLAAAEPSFEQRIEPARPLFGAARRRAAGGAHRCQADGTRDARGETEQASQMLRANLGRGRPRPRFALMGDRGPRARLSTMATRAKAARFPGLGWVR